MVRWTDGLIGGLIAGLVSAVFFLVVRASVDHDPVFGDYFVRFATAAFGPKLGSLPLLALSFGLFLHFFAAALSGIVYATIAARFKPMWSAPTSVVCGISYGLVMFFVAEDVVVPVMRVASDLPLWEGLIGNVFFHGIVLSEYITIAHRRQIAVGA